MCIHVMIFGLWLCFAAFLAIRVGILYVRYANKAKKAVVLRDLGVAGEKRLVGFFHPYCNAGGGGERVLWTAVALTQRTEPDVVCVVYSGDIDASKDEIISKVKSRFDIELSPKSLHFVFLKKRRFVEESTWPRFTLLGQSLGSIGLVAEALSYLIPDLFIDTMGYAFTFPCVALIGGVPVGAYVHYPTISTDMLERVRSRRTWHTNSDAISSSTVLSYGKLLYYRLFMYAYANCLRQASCLMVNSSWTKNHVDAILKHRDLILDIFWAYPWAILSSILGRPAPPRQADIVYPPCDTRAMASFSLEGREAVILSIQQFRPEKDHPAQLHALHAFFTKYPDAKARGVKLVLIGGSRNAEDAARVEDLRRLAQKLDLSEHVEFIVNAPYAELLRWLARASIGLSTMVDEHFGINVVEYMAAGLIPVTHASGGPLNDIVVPFNGKPTGFHATSPEEYAAHFHTVFSMSADEELELRLRARTWAVQRFSEEEFEKGWTASGWKKWLR